MFRTVNLFNIIYVIGICIIFESIFLFTTLFVSFITHDSAHVGIIISIVIITITGLAIILLTTNRTEALSRKESYYAAFWSWVVLSILGALPYTLTNSIPGFYNCIFESVSGFTTTGSSVISNIEALPKSILFWRSLTHWIGGLGILVLVVAIVSSVNQAGNNLMFSEGNIIEGEKIKPRITDVAKRLWVIYLALTIVESILLRIEGMTWFDSICHSFATIATGGFSTKNDSITSMSPAIQYTIAIFMILAGMNFVLHYKLFKFRFKQVFRNTELKTYIAIIAISTLIISINRYSCTTHINTVLRSSFFQVTSILSATGFSSDDYLHWNTPAQLSLFILMFIGACVGSTGGGIKIKRYVILANSVKIYIRKIIHPHAIIYKKVDDSVITNNTIRTVGAFITIYFITILTGTFVLIFDKLDFMTSFSAVTTTLGGIGPGFGTIGPVENFMDLPILSKLYLSFNMILGRLEIIPVLVLLHPSIRRY